MKIIKRSGEEVGFDITKIIAAVHKANKEVEPSDRLTTEQIQEMEMTPEMAGIRKITKMKEQIAVPGKIPAREEIPVHREMQVRTIWTRKMGKSWKIAWRRISSCWKTISSH